MDAKIDHSTLLTAPLPGPFSIHIANLQGGDIQFLTDLTALFCDPKNQACLDGLRSGRFGIYRDPQTHRVILSDLFVPPVVIHTSNSKN